MANRRRRTKEERIKIKKIKLGIFFVITVLLAVLYLHHKSKAYLIQIHKSKLKAQQLNKSVKMA